ncbi:Peptidase E [Arsenophonus endosymbiont of Bemisia tabaci Q2]|nr:Peptidase E [Arsenophonus endosymbiont of Bemisia tabaci Q2]
MDIFLLSNGRLTTNSQWLNYATSRLKKMFQPRQIRKALLVPYAVLHGDHNQRAAELSQSLGIEVVSIEYFESPVEAI